MDWHYSSKNQDSPSVHLVSKGRSCQTKVMSEDILNACRESEQNSNQFVNWKLNMVSHLHKCLKCEKKFAKENKKETL